MKIAFFWQALVEVLGVVREPFDWTNFRHVTDSGITQDVYRRQFDRDPSQSALAATERYFESSWRELLSSLPRDEVEVPGAREMLLHLDRDPDWMVAVATGGWGLTARAKLEGAEIDHEALALACANDAHAREDIMAIAHARAKSTNGNNDFERVVYVGDGNWDVTTCAKIGMPLVGMAVEPAVHDRLAELGVSHILNDYSDCGRVLGALEAANAPSA